MPNSSLARAQQLWNEWEIQCLVLVSFFLQAFLLFVTGVRKRVKSGLLNAAVWLAYQLADSVAIFCLGRLTLHSNGPGKQLILFWAPFLLLHLGGQETLTAFSMEDNILWGRHMLTFATQLTLVIYTIGMQWGRDKQLVAPMVLIFIVGTMKYIGRVLTLMVVEPSSLMVLLFPVPVNDSGNTAYDQRLSELLATNGGENSLDSLLELASLGYSLVHILVVVDFTRYYSDIHQLFGPPQMQLRSSQHRVYVAYKLAEFHLSLIYDILHTKFRREFLPVGNAMYLLITLCLTSTALALFARAAQKGQLFLRSNGADVIITYLLLVGAITLEISSIFIALISSYWPYINIRWGSLFIGESFFPGARRFLLRIARRLHPESRGEWSGKLPQNNLISKSIARKEATGVVRKTMHWIMQREVTHVDVSSALKKLLLDKLLDMVTTLGDGTWDNTRFNHQWAMLGSTGEAVLSEINLERMHFVTLVIFWHIVTDICFFSEQSEELKLEVTSASRELSNYVMYLVGDCHVMVDLIGRLTINLANDVMDGYASRSETSKLIAEELLRKARQSLQNLQDIGASTDDGRGISPGTRIESEFHQLASVSAKLLGIEDPQQRWELIATVWMEMLCYMAVNCKAEFHIKHLRTGGEFLTHVKTQLFIVGMPFSGVPNSKPPNVPFH